MKLSPRWALGLLLLTGCATANILPEKDRQDVSRALQGQVVYLRQSNAVMPFWSDQTKLLVNANPPDSIELLDNTSGQPILPGEPVGFLELGTRVYVDKIEFPTGLTVSRRGLFTPREYPWIYLSLVGEKHGRPYVAVLRQGIKSREELLAAFDQSFSKDDPTVLLKNYPPEVAAAIRAKKLMAGMDAEAVQMAWGHPERIRVEQVGGERVETWTWPTGKRTATLKSGKLVSTTPPLEQGQ